MEELIAAVKELLNTHFPGSDNQTELEETIPGQKIGGSFISSCFSGMQQLERQHAVRQVLEENLPRHDFLSVGLIFTLTPREVAAMEEASAV